MLAVNLPHPFQRRGPTGWFQTKIPKYAHQTPPTGPSLSADVCAIYGVAGCLPSGEAATVTRPGSKEVSCTTTSSNTGSALAASTSKHQHQPHSYVVITEQSSTCAKHGIAFYPHRQDSTNSNIAVCAEEPCIHSDNKVILPRAFINGIGIEQRQEPAVYQGQQGSEGEIMQCGSNMHRSADRDSLLIGVGSWIGLSEW